MLLALLAVSVGLLAGLVTGGRVEALRDFRPNLWWAPLAAAVLYVIPLLVDDLGGENVLAAMSLLVLLVAALANLHVAGLGVVAVGLALNLVPLAVDGATTVGPDAAATVDLDTDEDLGVARRLELPEDRVGLLGDRIPLPGLDWLVSFGDLIILVGLVDVGLRLTRPREGAAAPAVAAAAPAELGPEPAPLPETPVDDDPWFALVRGDRRDDPPEPVRTTGSLVGDRHASGEIRLTGIGAPTGEDEVVPFVDTATNRADELDLSLVRWADEPPPDDEDTDELDLRDLQNLLERDDSSSPSTTPPARPEPAGDRPAGPPSPPARDADGSFGDALARFDRDHDVIDLDDAAGSEPTGPRPD
ncbi:MAG: DUF5317 family protein [Actinomycetota bacterium]